MKFRTKVQSILALVALSIPAASAQVAPSDSNVKIEGFFTASYPSANQELAELLPNVTVFPTSETPLMFALSIEQTTENSVPTTNGPAVTWSGVSQTMTIEIFSVMGDVLYSESRSSGVPGILQHIVGTSDALPPPLQGLTYSARESFYSFIEVRDDLGFRRIETSIGMPSPFYFFDGGPHSQTETAILEQETPTQLYAATDGFPQFLLGETEQVIDLYIDRSIDPFSENPEAQEQDEYSASLYGYITSISALINDFDGDGIADEVDACEASILGETVLFDGWYDSGVTNYVDDSGCSVMDHYAACEAEEQEAPRRGIRSVRSGPSSCEKAVSYDLVADGVISYAEARALREALYESSTGSGRR